jgi:hypothetical protein
VGTIKMAPADFKKWAADQRGHMPHSATLREQLRPALARLNETARQIYGRDNLGGASMRETAETVCL